MLIYLILFISECLGKINKNTPQGDAAKQLSTLAVSNFAIPGDPVFPLNAMYAPPADRNQAGKLSLTTELIYAYGWVGLLNERDG